MHRFHLLLIFLFFCCINWCVSKSLDPKCKEKFPPCLIFGRTNVNTACANRGCGPKTKGCKELPPDAEFRKAMLDKHNELRNKIASGGDTTGGNQAAANMMALSYDVGLEFTAICHVHGCKMVHDSCRRTENFSTAGQNLALFGTTISKPVTDEDITPDLAPEKFKEMVQRWYDEIKLSDFTNSIDKYSFDHATGHFTALVWATTTHIGCARAIDRSSKYGYIIHLTCNYGPSGNIMRASIYIKGGACSQCPSGASCNAKYPALCGEIKDVYVGQNPYRAADIARGKQNSIHVYNILVKDIILLSVFISLFQ